MLNFLFWPFALCGRLIGFLLSACGRLLSLMLGAILAVVGAVLCATLIGAIPGIPITIFGAALIFRSIF